MHSYVPKHRTVEELQPIAISLIGANGSVSVDHGRNALVLVGEAEVVARLLQVLRERDTPPRTIALDYGFISLRELRRRGPELHWSRASSEYRVGVLNTTDPASSSRWQAHWHRDDEPSRGTIRLQEGSTARLSAIEAKPLYSVFFGGRRRAFGAGFEGLLVGRTGIDVEARILGSGHVALRLQLREAATDERSEFDRPSEIVGTGAQTMLQLVPGKTSVVAAHGPMTEPVSSYQSRHDRRESDRALLIRVTLEPATQTHDGVNTPSGAEETPD